MLAPQAQQQIQDLRLDRDIEPGDDLVGDEKARLGAERARDVDALALAAAELRRKARRQLLRQAGVAQQRQRALMPLGAAYRLALRLERLRHEIADPPPRIERGDRVLKDHLHRPDPLRAKTAAAGSRRRPRAGCGPRSAPRAP